MANQVLGEIKKTLLTSIHYIENDHRYLYFLYKELRKELHLSKISHF